jgi:hypothetical protein
MPATCAAAKALPACTAALQDADTDCYGTVNKDCTTATGTDEGSTCATVNLKPGDTLDPTEDPVTFAYTGRNFVPPATCTLMKTLLSTLDITCADAATSCDAGTTCALRDPWLRFLCPPFSSPSVPPCTSCKGIHHARCLLNCMLYGTSRGAQLLTV